MGLWDRRDAGSYAAAAASPCRWFSSGLAPSAASKAPRCAKYTAAALCQNFTARWLLLELLPHRLWASRRLFFRLVTLGQAALQICPEELHRGNTRDRLASSVVSQTQLYSRGLRPLRSRFSRALRSRCGAAGTALRVPLLLKEPLNYEFQLPLLSFQVSAFALCFSAHERPESTLKKALLDLCGFFILSSSVDT